MAVIPLISGMAPRLATPADVPEIVRVVNAAYRVESFFITGDRTTAVDVAARVAAPQSAFLVFDAAPGRLAAAVHVAVRDGRCWFGMLSVDPVEQGRGHARTLLAATDAWAVAHGCTEEEIEVVDLRTELPGFYAQFGFMPVGERPFPDPHKLKRPAKLAVMRRQVPGG
jgi:GNAT superfamily N-acetyltransferase